jgi:arginine deiminase
MYGAKIFSGKYCIIITMGNLAIDSEIGTLRRVVLHTPGDEIEAMTPEEAEKDLYNDIIPLESVLNEYVHLKKFLSTVAEVFELTDILAACLVDIGNKFEFLSDLLKCLPIRSSMEWLMALSSQELATRIVRGIAAPENSLAYRLDSHAFISRPLPNMYFMRDSAAVLGDSVISAATAYDVRMVEAFITRFIFTHHPDFSTKKILFDGASERNRYLTLEGGDILVLSPNLLAIGISERTTPHAIERIARNLSKLSDTNIKIFAVDLPKTRATIHLDMVFTMIDRDAALLYEPVILGPKRSSVFRIESGKNGKLHYSEVESLLSGLASEGLELDPILCGDGHRIRQQREQWLSGANSFAFAPGKILMYSCNTYTAQALSRKGYSIIPSDRFINGKESVGSYSKLAVTFDGIELARGGGGARCMTLPVERDPVT